MADDTIAVLVLLGFILASRSLFQIELEEARRSEITDNTIANLTLPVVVLVSRSFP